MQITIDNNKYEFNKGETVLDIAKRNGISIPTLCNDERLKPYSSCFVCVVAIEGMRGMQPSCSTLAVDGMIVQSNHEKVYKARQTALNLLLSNHYADCYAPCHNTCPAGVDVQGYISLIEKGKYKEAIALVKESNPLPAICGRVCVRPCEVACRRNLADEGKPVGIDYLKRFAADKDLMLDSPILPQIADNTEKKVAVIGAGPGGLSAAYFLRLQGHEITIFEASPAAGGWLRYGIPEYRLPNNIIDAEVKRITDLGVQIKYNTRLGDDLKYQQINNEFDATILAIGAQKGSLAGCKGDDAEGVYAGITVLRQMEESGEKMDFNGKTVAVIGGGNTAMDCCRTAIRCGAEKVYVLYRRTEKEMPANPIEIHESKLEGVEYKFLTAPTEIKKDNNGVICAVTCLQMELGAPDASGRQRPIPVEGSEFDIPVDFIMAAIGQKSDIRFVDDINSCLQNEKLEVSKWDYVTANDDTLQTSVKHIFACGDGVTGPATLIQAVGQARIAANSCHQYLSNQVIQPLPYEFVSKKDNFKPQENSDYKGRFKQQQREEMPVLTPDNRINFDEVELGYQNEDIAKKEANRCLECGCQAVYSCDLKRYASEYGATQVPYKGAFKQTQIDFSHPHIEIDNSKCILCSRCIRTCSDIVGANALGLVERGFDTYVAPAGGNSLTDTHCEDCGMCISVCPTGALTLNTTFKPGPIKTESATTICDYCSVGCELEVKHKDGFIYSIDGSKGMVNSDACICGKPRFGFEKYNSKDRITRPLKKENDQLIEISFEEAYQIISEKLSTKSAFFVSPRLTNEELALIKKLATKGVKTDNIGSFQYLDGVAGYAENYVNNVPLSEISKAESIFTLGVDIAKDHPVVGFMMNKVKVDNNIPIISYTAKDDFVSEYKCDNVIKIKSYLNFIKAVNYFLISQDLVDIDYTATVKSFDYNSYKNSLLKENYDTLVTQSGVNNAIIEKFALNYRNNSHATLVVSETELTNDECTEIHNLSILTGKDGTSGNGIITLKARNNSQGLMDLQMCKDLTTPLKNGEFDSLFIFGEDPLGSPGLNDANKSLIRNCGYVIVQDYCKTATVNNADLVLPASYPIEIGGSFTNSQKNIQNFKNFYPSNIKHNSMIQTEQTIKMFSLK